MTISEMLKNRADLLGQIRQFLDTHEDKQGKLSAEDHTTYQNMETEFDSLTEAINRAQRIEQREAELAKPVNSPITGKPYTAASTGEEKKGRASDAYKQAVSDNAVTMDGFGTIPAYVHDGLAMLCTDGDLPQSVLDVFNAL